MIDSTKIKQIESKINKKIARLKDTIADLEVNTQPISPENSIGRVSRMDAINNKSVLEGSLRKAKDTLGKLQEALQNINQEDFGACQKCKKEIAFERLLFMPESRRCSGCARQAV